MGSAVLQVGRFADPKESRVQISKRSDMGSEFCKGVDLLILRNRVSGWETFRYEQCRPARSLIC